ncbi:MAG: hypothetical protein HG464_003985, partial [Bacteroidia bacterium]|nr:hypothetical protein [Bacteroidia bacterium]
PRGGGGIISWGAPGGAGPGPASPKLPPAEVLPVPVKPIDRLTEARDGFGMEE